MRSGAGHDPWLVGHTWLDKNGQSPASWPWRFAVASISSVPSKLLQGRWLSVICEILLSVLPIHISLGFHCRSLIFIRLQMPLTFQPNFLTASPLSQVYRNCSQQAPSPLFLMRPWHCPCRRSIPSRTRLYLRCSMDCSQPVSPICKAMPRYPQCAFCRIYPALGHCNVALMV